MKNSKNIWESLLKFSLGLILVMSFLLVKMKYGWDPLDRCSLPPDSILIESITLSDSVMNIEVNNTQNLLAQIEPANATNKNLKWSSSDTTVAIVDPTTGRVTATGKSGDECIVTATAADDSGKSADIIIKVKKGENNPDILVGTIIFPNSNGEITLNPDSIFKIDAKALPEGATNKTLKWMSGNVGVATVDNNGVVTGKSEGNCTITAFSTDGSNVVKSIKVHVQKIVKKVTSIDFDKSTLTINIGDKKQIVAKVLPVEATNKTLAWKSSNEGIATVNNGFVTGKSKGNCTVTALSTDGGNVIKSITVHVQQIDKEIKVTSISLDKSNITIGMGSQTQIHATVHPSNATNKILKWESSNPKVANINNGKIIPVKSGDCVITVYSTDGSNKTAKCSVQIKNIDDGLSTDAKVKRYLDSFKNKTLAREIKTLFTSNAIVKIMDDGTIVNRRNASDYIDIVSNSSIIQKIKFVDMKVNSDNKITELTVEEVYNN
jgi:uncharacterized protein YjdB